MKSNRRVLILNPYVATLGGGEKLMGYLCQFIEEYFNYDVSIEILVHNYNEINVFSDDYITIDDLNKRFGLDLRKTKFKKIEYRDSRNMYETLKNKKYIEDITKGYDLFINHMFLSKHIGKAKVNVYECMFPPMRYAATCKEKIIHKLGAKVYDLFFYHSYKSIISISQFTNHWMTFYWKRSVKNKVIYPPVFCEEEIRGRYDDNSKKNIIISVGRFFVGSHSKKQLDMVKFFVDNSNVFEKYEYHLVGGVSNHPEDIEYLNEIKKESLKVKNVIIHENCKLTHLIELYKQAKVFWHGTGYLVDENAEPEKMEHFGITTVEAMSYGVVPIVIRKGGQNEIVDEGLNGYCWDNKEECISKTVEIIKDDELRVRMAKNAAIKAKEYSVEKFYDMNRRLFNELQI